MTRTENPNQRDGTMPDGRDAAARIAALGWAVLADDTRVQDWAVAAHRQALRVTSDPVMRARWLRHGETWFAGVDALPNAPDGSIGDVRLAGPWDSLIRAPAVWHKAQLSVLYPGYPVRDPDESEAAYRFRRDRDAAHLDGLLAEGPNKRRFLREPHAFVLGLPLTPALPGGAGGFVIWEGSHLLIGRAFAQAFAGLPAEHWPEQDVTDLYQSVRREVFETCPRRIVTAGPGETILVHRMAIHGTAPWPETVSGPAEGRMIVWFRPQLATMADWLKEDGTTVG